MLDQNQLEAVHFNQGPCLCLAGPGSGKTTVLVNRIKYLCCDIKVPQEQILVITFTKDAALEMKNRFMKLAGLSGVNFGTFHSVFFQILKQEMHLDSKSILQGNSLVKFLKEVFKACNIRVENDDDFSAIYKEISFINNTKTSLEEYEVKSISKPKFIKIYNTYNKMKRDFDKLDFDDMLLMTEKMFRENKSILQKWQKKFSYYLIDEMQDMNDVQFEIVKLLAVDENIFAVGDDDQSIYGFRGANPSIMMDFPNTFSACKVIRLSINYRSKSAIVSSASNVINNNKTRFDKDIKANSKEEGEVRVFAFKTDVEEAKWVVDSIEKEIMSDVNSTTAVLFRNRNQAALVSSLLKKKGIDFFQKEESKTIYEHWIFRDVISYFNIALFGGSREDFLRIYNKPNRYIHRASIDRENVKFKDIIKFYNDKPYMKQRVYELEKDISRIKNMLPSSAVIYVRKRIGYDDFIKEYAASKKQYDEYMKILDEITSLAREHRSIRIMLEDIKVRENFNENNKEEIVNRVFLHTFHGSKGLEFDKVYLIDVCEGVTPSKKAEDEKMLEEERRMFYVAMTRAKSTLNICYINNRNNERLFPSRFIDEMKKAP